MEHQKIRSKSQHQQKFIKKKLKSKENLSLTKNRSNAYRKIILTPWIH